MSMRVGVVDALLAFAEFGGRRVRCERDQMRERLRCAEAADPPPQAYDFQCRRDAAGAWVCDEEAPLRVGEPVILLDGGEGYLHATVDDEGAHDVVVSGVQQRRRVRPERLQRPLYDDFFVGPASRRGAIEVPVLARLPSALVVSLHADSGAAPRVHFFCHGCFESSFAAAANNAGGVLALFGDAERLYEGEGGVPTADRAAARQDSFKYEHHPLKWSDIGLDGARPLGGRPLLPLARLTEYADAMGLDARHALIRGHQDLVNVGCVGGPPARAPWIDAPADSHYHKMLLLLSPPGPGAYDVPYRFVSTSSAVFSKHSQTGRPDDMTLVHSCWLELRGGRLTAHLRPAKPPIDGRGFRDDERPLDLVVDFWAAIEYVRDEIRYPRYVNNGVMPDPGKEGQTRLFSRTYVNAVFGAAQRLYDEYAPPHVVYYERRALPADARVCILGDLHSCIDSLAKMLLWCRAEGFFEADSVRLRPDHHLVFLGDLVDRGPFGVDILTLVLQLKIANEEQVDLVHGNHETSAIYNRDGLASEILGEYAS